MIANSIAYVYERVEVVPGVRTGLEFVAPVIDKVSPWVEAADLELVKGKSLVEAEIVKGRSLVNQVEEEYVKGRAFFQEELAKGKVRVEEEIAKGKLRVEEKVALGFEAVKGEQAAAAKYTSEMYNWVLTLVAWYMLIAYSTAKDYGVVDQIAESGVLNKLPVDEEEVAKYWERVLEFMNRATESCETEQKKTN